MHCVCSDTAIGGGLGGGTGDLTSSKLIHAWIGAVVHVVVDRIYTSARARVL